MHVVRLVDLHFHILCFLYCIGDVGLMEQKLELRRREREGDFIKQ